MHVDGSSNIKALIILPRNKFQDEEFLTVKSQLDKDHIEYNTAACCDKIATGSNGIRVRPDCTFDNIDFIDYDAVILIGGVGSIEHWHNKKVLGLLTKANRFGKLICAICLAPITLANAGLLKNRKATAYNSAATYLRSRGAIFTGSPIEISDNIITANGPEAAREFARAIIGYLADRQDSGAANKVKKIR
jgi:protease I